MSIISDLGLSQKNPSGQTFVGQMNALDKSDHGASAKAADAQNGADSTADASKTAEETKKGSGTLPIPTSLEKSEDNEVEKADAVPTNAGPSLVPLDAELKQDGTQNVLDLSVLDDPPNAAKGWDPVPPSATIIAGKIPVGVDDEENAAEKGTAKEDAKAAEPSEEHYEVKVQHYANYDKSADSGYGEQVQENLNYASKTPWSRFIVDFMTVMVRPIHFWEGQAEHQATLGQVHFPHLVVLVLLRAVSIYVGRVLQQGTDKLNELIWVLAQALLIFVFVWLLALIYSGIMAVVSKGFHFSKCLNFVAYAITPLLVIHVLSVFPIPYMNTICDIIALPYVFVVLGAGMLPFLKVPEKTAPILCGLFCGLMTCLWSVLPILMPRLINL